MGAQPTRLSGRSITVRLQRVTVEYAEVEVPLDTAELTEGSPASALFTYMDPDRLMQQAIEMAQSSQLEWRFHRQSVDLAPSEPPSPHHE